MIRVFPVFGLLVNILAHMRIENGDVGLHVSVEGSPDAPPVVLLHGIIGYAGTWDWIVPELATRYRVIRLDFRAHGESDRAPGAYRMDDYLSDAVAVCTQVAGGPAAIIGHSLGGATAAALAQTRPELVRGVLLEDAPLFDMQQMPGSESEADALLAGFALMRQTIPQLQRAGMSVEGLVGMLGMMPGPSGTTLGSVLLDDGMRTMAAGMLACDVAVLDPILDHSIGTAFDPRRSIAVPLTAVAADPAMPDAVTRPEDLDQLRAVNPHADTYTITGAGHLIHDSRNGRARFTEIVTGFLAGPASPNGS